MSWVRPQPGCDEFWVELSVHIGKEQVGNSTSFSTGPCHCIQSWLESRHGILLMDSRPFFSRAPSCLASRGYPARVSGEPWVSFWWWQTCTVTSLMQFTRFSSRPAICAAFTHAAPNMWLHLPWPLFVLTKLQCRPWQQRWLCSLLLPPLTHFVLFWQSFNSTSLRFWVGWWFSSWLGICVILSKVIFKDFGFYCLKGKQQTLSIWC